MAWKSGFRSVPGTASDVRGLPLAGDGVDDRELDLVIVGAEVDVERVDRVEDLLRAGVLAVDLVDDHDRGQAEGEALAEHEAGLRQRPLGGVDQQQDAVDEAQPALDLAAEVGVARGVDDVDLVPPKVTAVFLARMVMPFSRSRSLRVHDPIGHGLVDAEDPRLPQHEIDEGGLPVVDVGDDGDVAELETIDHDGLTIRRKPALPADGRRPQAVASIEEASYMPSSSAMSTDRPHVPAILRGYGGVG